MNRRRWLVFGVGLLLMWTGCSPAERIETVTLEPVLFQHRVTTEGVLASARVTPISVPPDVQRTVRVAWLAPEGGRVSAGDVIARFDDGSMRERLIEGQSELSTVSHRIAKGAVESVGRGAEIDGDLKVAELELDVAERFQLTDDSIFSRHEIIESQIDEALAGDRRDHAIEARGTHRSLSETERALLAIDERKAQAKITQANSGLQALEVRAPHDGLLTFKRTWQGEPMKVGSELWGGQAIAEIPDLATLEAQVYVLEADAGGVEVGRPASVVVEAQPDEWFAAHITQVDAVAKPRFRGSPVQYFGVTLTFDGEVDVSGLKPGQRVRATLMLAEKEQAIVVPRQALFTAEGENRVWVQTANGFAARSVEIGASSMGLVELVGGVGAGDVVALATPTTRTDSTARPTPASASDTAVEDDRVDANTSEGSATEGSATEP